MRKIKDRAEQIIAKKCGVGQSTVGPTVTARILGQDSYLPQLALRPIPSSK
jgi:hypothetical protein